MADETRQLTTAVSGRRIELLQDQIVFMPWYNGNFPPSYKNQPEKIRDKATEIANELLLNGAEEGVAIATGLKRAREWFAKQNAIKKRKPGN
jgi:hypothetical protein